MGKREEDEMIKQAMDRLKELLLQKQAQEDMGCNKIDKSGNILGEEDKGEVANQTAAPVPSERAWGSLRQKYSHEVEDEPEEAEEVEKDESDYEEANKSLSSAIDRLRELRRQKQQETLHKNGEDHNADD